MFRCGGPSATTGVSSPPHAPDTWGVSRAEITSRAADCASPMATPGGEVVQAAGGTGSLAWRVGAGGVAPCELDADVELSFEAPPAWAPQRDTMRATGVTVAGGCM
jgi:hypothetical protein